MKALVVASLCGVLLCSPALTQTQDASSRIRFAELELGLQEFVAKNPDKYTYELFSEEDWYGTSGTGLMSFVAGAYRHTDTNVVSIILRQDFLEVAPLTVIEHVIRHQFCHAFSGHVDSIEIKNEVQMNPEAAESVTEFCVLTLSGIERYLEYRKAYDTWDLGDYHGTSLPEAVQMIKDVLINVVSVKQ